MSHEHYVEHVLSSLTLNSKEDLQAHLRHLDSILERIDKVPSPQKESLLVRLILSPRERPRKAEPAHPSP